MSDKDCSITNSVTYNAAGNGGFKHSWGVRDTLMHHFDAQIVCARPIVSLHSPCLPNSEYCSTLKEQSFWYGKVRKQYKIGVLMLVIKIYIYTVSFASMRFYVSCITLLNIWIGRAIQMELLPHRLTVQCFHVYACTCECMHDFMSYVLIRAFMLEF